MGTVEGPLRVLWCTLVPRAHRGIFVVDVDLFVSGNLDLWLTWISETLVRTMVLVVLEPARSTVVTVILVWSVDSVDILGSWVLPVPLVSVDSVDPVVSVVAVVSVESVVSSC